MRKLLLLACALSVLPLVSCAPLLQTVQGEAGSVSRDGSSIILSNPGPDAMTETVMRVEGTDLLLGAPCEYRAPNVYGCLIGTVPAGSKYRVTPALNVQTGKVGVITRASANFYKGPSGLFRRLELP